MLVYLEGVDGVGKSTQIAALKQAFSRATFTAEPFNAALREILLSGRLQSKEAEALLFLADRAEHFKQVLSGGVLQKSNLIFSDRGFVSGVAYGVANGGNLAQLLELNRFALQGCLEGKFVLLEGSERLFEARLNSRKSQDAIESRGFSYLLRVQEAMRQVLEFLKADFIVIDASLPQVEVMQKIVNFVKCESNSVLTNSSKERR